MNLLGVMSVTRTNEDGVWVVVGATVHKWLEKETPGLAHIRLLAFEQKTGALAAFSASEVVRVMGFQPFVPLHEVAQA